MATTLYQAVYFSGYVIEQRFEHAYRIRAYEIKPELAGIDATVYYPYVDFQFTNNTDVPLLVSAQAGGGRVTISLYSTKPNWTVQTDRPVLTNQTPKGGVDIINRRTVTDATGNQRVYNSTSHYDRTEG